MTSTQDLLKQVADLVSSNPKRTEELYKQILDSTASTSNGSAVNAAKEQSLRDQESALIKLTELYRNQKDANGLAQIDVLTNNVEWSKREKRIFLKRSLEIHFVSLTAVQVSLNYRCTLVRVERLDDKTILTEVHLLESCVYHGIGNLSKSKVSPSGAIPVFSLCALTSVRTAANSIYCPPHLQAAFDLQSGVLRAEDKDYTTTYSYFYETFENMSSQDDPAALNALKYMLLCKVMLNMLAVKYAQLCEIESMHAIAHQNRNFDFEMALRDYKHELLSDPTIRSHLAVLYDALLQQHLLRIVEPYSVVEIDYFAKQVEQGRQDVEAKLSQMFLDKAFHDVLDQGRGCLINAYGAAIGTLERVS
ncbi:hypothetical protein BDR05DRAFT_1019543 [Suillus weaverae]|nr:hypothetical protein BDR05DRAFT_1019543 [Suillus weaverae]